MKRYDYTEAVVLDVEEFILEYLDTYLKDKINNDYSFNMCDFAEYYNKED